MPEVLRPVPRPTAALPTLPCACANLRRAARAVTQLYDHAFRGSGLRATQFTLLQVLGRSGEMRQGTLGGLLALDSTTLSRTLRPLERRGWIEFRAGSDRRERYWALTSAGRRQLERARPRWDRVQAKLRARLGQDRWQRMLAELVTVAEAAGDAGGEALLA